MNMGLGRGALLGLAALAAAGCTSGQSMSGAMGSGSAAAASVTRFHLGQQIARGEIAVAPIDPSMSASADFPRFAVAVERQLQALGWTIVRGPARSEQVALVRVEQGTREQFARRAGINSGIGGGIGGAPFVGRRGQVVVTELAVRLQRRSDGTAMWEGRSQLEARAGTPLADRANAVERLAAALFQGFPGESGRTIRVR